MNDLEKLLERIEAATGPDREIDIALGYLLDGWKTTITPKLEDFAYLVNNNGLDKSLPHYTASLDAAVALAGRVMPGWRWNLHGPQTSHPDDGEPDHGNASLWHPYANLLLRGKSADASGANPALALCACVVTAKMENPS